MRPEDLTIERLEEHYGSKATFWEGRCYGLACAAAELIDGAEAVYGHWLGEVDKRGFWGARKGEALLRHGWVKLPDGRVLDPTRWSFEAVPPYIFLGVDPENYDWGGQHWRRATRPPPPADDSEVEQTTLRLSRGALDQLNGLLGRKPSSTFTNAQVFWLSNAPYEDLYPHAREFYESLRVRGLIGYVPIDHLRMDQTSYVPPAPERSERSPVVQAAVDLLARAAFGRTPRKGQCVICRSTQMAPGDFRDEISLRESRISYQCQACQDTTDAQLKALEEDEEEFGL